MKRDLNLIPRAEAQSDVNKFLLPVLLIVVIYAATAYLAITIPRQRLQAKEDEHAVVEQKVADLEYIEVEYQLLRQQLAEVEAKKQTILLTTHSDKDVINLIYIVEEACPEEILLTEIFITDEGIVLEGESPTDSLVAELMVNLRANELFAYSNITKVSPSEIDLLALQEAFISGQELADVRKFSIYLAYPVPVEDEEAQAGDS